MHNELICIYEIISAFLVRCESVAGRLATGQSHCTASVQSQHRAAGSISLAVSLLMLGITQPVQGCCNSLPAEYVLLLSLHTCSRTTCFSVCPVLVQGSLCWLAMCRVHRVLSAKLGKPCGRAFLLITAIQFHLPFYMSRTLPNTFATAVLGFALADWMDARHPRRLVSLLVFATVRAPTVVDFPSACLHLICTGISLTPSTSLRTNQ